MTGPSSIEAASTLERIGVVVHESALAGPPGHLPPRPSAPRRPSRPRAAIRRLVHAVGRSTFGTRVLMLALEDSAVRRAIDIRLSNTTSANASFALAAERALSTRPARFSECAWLFSSNPLNHGLARLELDEAAYIFELVRSMDAPRVVEIGRFKGGTSFLFAAAGAELLSIDFDLEGEAQRAPDLIEALKQFGLRDRVRLVVADSRAYPAPPDTVDIVFVDGDHSYDGVTADFAHWWPALRTGGHMVFHDADRRYPWIEGVADAIEEIAARSDVELQRCPPSLGHAVKV